MEAQVNRFVIFKIFESVFHGFVGVTGAAQPTHLNWGIWTNWPRSILKKLEAILRSDATGGQGNFPYIIIVVR